MHKYLSLIRFDKPVGIFLLLWPTLTALWIASSGKPSINKIVIFISGVFITRALGCILNDLADRNFDRHVDRTKMRPLATGVVSIKAALLLSAGLAAIAFCLVLLLNSFTILLSLLGILLIACYPFAKRFTHLPQVVLGITFNLGVLMAFSAQVNKIPAAAWLLYGIALLWTVAYDTQYGMIDKNDDLKIGVKSTAIFCGTMDRLFISSLHLFVLLGLFVLGNFLQMRLCYYLSLLFATGFFIYQYFLIYDRSPQNCLKAFINNQWAWLSVFIGVVLNYF